MKLVKTAKDYVVKTEEIDVFNQVNSMKKTMKKILIILVATFFITLPVKGQSFFFIGEHSYPSTETFILQSNSDGDYVNELSVVFAKDGTKGLIIVSSKLVSTVRISGKLIIYLNNGTVIVCNEEFINDNVNGTALSAYHLTEKELNEMKNSNINTIRYVIKCAECLRNPLYEGNYTASNTGNYRTNFPTVITKFFNK